MHKLQTVCDGQKDGFECAHYWRVASRAEVLNPQAMKVGRFEVTCMVHPSRLAPMGDGEGELATYCNQYKPTDRPYQSREDLIKTIGSYALPQPAPTATGHEDDPK